MRVRRRLALGLGLALVIGVGAGLALLQTGMNAALDATVHTASQPHANQIAEAVVGGPIPGIDPERALQLRSALQPDGIYFIPLPTGTLDHLDLAPATEASDAALVGMTRAFDTTDIVGPYAATEFAVTEPLVIGWAVAPETGDPFLYASDL